MDGVVVDGTQGDGKGKKEKKEKNPRNGDRTVQNRG